MALTKRRSYDLILGIFVAFGLFVLILLVFLIGRERRLFDSTVRIEAHFPNVAGLALGADVMLAGVVVGHVNKISFPNPRPGPHQKLRDVTIVMDVAKSSLQWIRLDSIARIDSKGLLGDKLINISIGSPEHPQVEAGAMLHSTPPVDLNQSLQQAQKILENVTETISGARDVIKGFMADGGDTSLANSAKSLQKIFKEIETGSGILHELIYDKKAAEDSKELIANAKSISLAIKQGDGLAQALLYDPEGQKTVKHLNDILYNLSTLLGDEKAKQILVSIATAAGDLEAIAADVKSGKGSLGLLLKDPSLYNEAYGLIGNLRRNRLLKAIIRYGISQQDVNGSPVN